MVETKLIDKQGNMDANIEKKYHRGSEIESNIGFTITSADQHYSSHNLLQILSKFLHRVHLVDLIAGFAGVLSLQPSLNFQRRKHGR